MFVVNTMFCSRCCSSEIICAHFLSLKNKIFPAQNISLCSTGCVECHDGREIETIVLKSSGTSNN